jgi:hypothetical protein
MPFSFTRPVPSAKHKTAPTLDGHTFHSVWGCEKWKRLGPDDILPMMEPGQKWVDQQLIEHGIGAQETGYWNKMSRNPHVLTLSHSCCQPLTGSGLYYGLTGNQRSLRATEAALAFWKEYRERVPDRRADGGKPGLPHPTLADTQVQDQLSILSVGRTVHGLFPAAAAMGRPGLLDWFRDHCQWWIEVVGYEKEHYFRDHVNDQGKGRGAGAFVFNKECLFAGAMWRLGELYGIEQFRQIGEEIILKRVLPAQFEDGYWNYSESVSVPTSRKAPAGPHRLDNYSLLTAGALSELLVYPRWRDDVRFKEVLLRACRYAMSLIDGVGCLRGRPNRETYVRHKSSRPRCFGENFAQGLLQLTRAGTVYGEPELIDAASRVTNFWYAYRPVLFPFFEGGRPSLGEGHIVSASDYTLTARFMLVLAWEGWHVRRKNASTVELVHEKSV